MWQASLRFWRCALIRALARTLARSLLRLRGARRVCAPARVRAAAAAARRAYRARAHADACSAAACMRAHTAHHAALRAPPSRDDHTSRHTHTRPLTHCFLLPPCAAMRRRTPPPTRSPSWRAWTPRGRTTAPPCTHSAVRLLAPSFSFPHTHHVFFALRSHFPFFFLCFSLASGIFLVLDRAYVLPLPGVRPLWEAGLACLRTHLATHPALTAKAVRGLLGAIERERGGEGAAARPLLKSLLRLLAALVRRATQRISCTSTHMRKHNGAHNSPLFLPRFLQGIYGDAFERPFLEASASFYAAESSLTLSQTDVPGYLAHAETRLQEESERCGAYLEPATRKPLTAAVEKALVASHVAQLLDKGFGELMAAAAHRVPDLARLYALLGRVGAHDALRAALSRRVSLRCAACMHTHVRCDAHAGFLRAVTCADAYQRTIHAPNAAT
jgi:hypothetical protein